MTEWFWQYDGKWELIAFQGNTPQDGISITGRSGTVELKTSADATPRPVSHVEADRDVNISWLLKNTDEKRCASSLSFMLGPFIRRRKEKKIVRLLSVRQQWYL